MVLLVVLDVQVFVEAQRSSSSSSSRRRRKDQRGKGLLISGGYLSRERLNW